MNAREFQRRYHEYSTANRDEAQRIADMVTLDDGHHPVVVGLPCGAITLYCLMVPSAAELIHTLHPEIDHTEG